MWIKVGASPFVWVLETFWECEKAYRGVEAAALIYFSKQPAHFLAHYHQMVNQVDFPQQVLHTSLDLELDFMLDLF